MKQGIKVSGRGEAGASLVELLAALGIVAAALAVFVTALSTGAFAVSAADRLTTATNLTASQLESIKGAPYDAAGAYDFVTTPSGYSITLSSSEIITGLQQVTVTVSHQGDALVTVSNYKTDR